MGRRYAFTDWDLPDHGLVWSQVDTAVLLDIRELLQKLLTSSGYLTNLTVLNCREFREIPRVLRKIAANTDKYKCKEHPRYQGLRPPKVDCISCRRVFRKRRA